MSTLNVNTIADATGSNPVAQSYVSSGTVKVSINFNGDAATIRGSLNVASLTDNAAGEFIVNFTSDTADNNYSIAGACGDTDAGAGHRIFTIGHEVAGFGVLNTTSSHRIGVHYGPDNNTYDATHITSQLVGDLA